MYHNIPLELQQLPQWVCWRYEDKNGRKTKVPYCPSLHNPVHASIHNPSTWGSFADAIAAARGPAMDGIGLVLTEDDPYTGIDIDDKAENPATEAQHATHIKILEAFQSYTERSVGARWYDDQGKERGGYHIIIRGKIKGGRDRGHVGVYSTARYLTFSGDVVRNAPIAEYQELLLRLIAEMPESDYAGELDEVEGHLTDQELHEMALRAENGEKYARLARGEVTYRDDGDPTSPYQSRSESDLALISILAYYTRDNEQVRRMFRYTVPGKREKHQGNNRWIDRCIKRFRAQQPTSYDIEEARAAAARMALDFDAKELPQHSTDRELDKALQADAEYIRSMGGDPGPTLPQMGIAAEYVEVSAPSEPVVTPVTSVVPAPPAPAPAGSMYGGMPQPPGLVGELAAYFRSSATRPVPEAALMAAIGIAAGVAGRAYNISGTGLNHYMLLLADTGVGKEGIAKGINNLLAATRTTVPMVDDFIGPSAFASGQALVRVFDGKPCFLSILGEFALTLKAMNDPRAPGPMVILRKVLLDLYGKSGWTDILQSTAYSDQEKNTKNVHAPSLSIIGECVPDTFYSGIDLADISDGLIPRFHVVEYTGNRQPRNKASGQPPSQQLVQQFANLCASALSSQHGNACAAVQIAPDAEALLDAFDVMADTHINTAGNGGERQLWNRAHLKALKLAGLIAVGVNPHAPTVTADIAQWAITFTQRNTEHLLSRFAKGEVGSGESKQFSEVRRVIGDFFKMDKDKLKPYTTPEVQAAGLVPYKYLLIRLVRLASFTHDKRGGTRAVQDALDQMVKMGMLSMVNAEMSSQRFGTRQVHYALSGTW